MLIMSTPIMVVKTIVRKTKAQMFKDVKIGHRIQSSIEIKSPTRGYSGPHASYIRTENIDTGDVTFNTFNMLANLLECFELEEDNGPLS